MLAWTSKAYLVVVMSLQISASTKSATVSGDVGSLNIPVSTRSRLMRSKAFCFLRFSISCSVIESLSPDPPLEPTHRVLFPSNQPRVVCGRINPDVHSTTRSCYPNPQIPSQAPAHQVLWH